MNISANKKKILLTGATGYIGKRILPVLVNKGYHVICCVRDKKRFVPPASLLPHIEVIEVDFLEKDSLSHIPEDIDGAYYLLHSMSTSKDYRELEKRSAENFRDRVSSTSARHVIYLSGIINEEHLSDHLSSRKNVEMILSGGSYQFTALRAGIIIGSGSASFEIIRDLVEKLPLMVAPRWLNTKCQPIAVRDVIQFLTASLFKEETFDQSFDIGGPDILSYKQMLLGLASLRGLKRIVITVPVMTPRLSSYWLYFVTSTSYKLAIALVDSMKVNVVCRDTRLNGILGIKPMSYRHALERTFIRIEQNEVVSSWKDSFVSGRINIQISDFLNVPTYGCFVDKRERKFNEREQTMDMIWKIGGDTGWYYANHLWQLRGLLDKMAGGVGLRRGRTHPDKLQAGDAIDFWRVLYANKDEGRLLLFAEMKLHGEAWLEFRLTNDTLVQTATFRPRGLYGRAYWYAVYPFHGIVFSGLIKKLSGSVKG